MDICRICLEEESPDNPLLSLCKCKGGLVHSSCLEKWILHKGNTECEICKSEYENIKTNYKFKNDTEVIGDILKLFTSVSTIFFSLTIYDFKNNNSQSVNALKFLYFLFFLELINSNEFKCKISEIDSIEFNN